MNSIKLLLINVLFALTACSPHISSTPIDSRYVGCLIVSVTSHNDTNLIFGGGFFVNDKYFATCYHVYKGLDTMKVVAGYVFYNYRAKGDSTIHDTVSIDINYKYRDDQYDFTKHKLDSTDISSDFVVLKLIRTVNVSASKIADSNARIPDSLESFTLIPLEDRLSLEMGKMRPVLQDTVKSSKPYTVIYATGTSREGFSGAPVYNQNHEIIGIIERGYDIVPDFLILRFLNRGLINPMIASEIVYDYKQGRKLCAIMKIDYLKERYLSGFDK